MKKGKTLLIPVLVLMLALVLAACGASASDAEAAQPSAPTRQAAAEPSPVAPASTPEPPVDGYQEDGKIHVYLLGEGEKVDTPESSFIRYLEYYADSQHLIINMNGSDYVFANVDADLWQAFRAAESKGRFYNANIKGNSAYWVADYDGTNGSLIVVEHVE